MTDLRKTAEIVLGQSEVLRVTSEGQFIWHEDADRMIEQGDFSHSPAMPYILKALRKREWVGLTDEEILDEYRQCYGDDGTLTDCYFARAIIIRFKGKNGG